MSDDRVLDLAEQLNDEYSAGLVIAQRENGNYDIGMVSGAKMQDLYTDASDDFAQCWMEGALFGANVGKAMAPTEAAEPTAYTAMILKGQMETVVVGAKGNALVVEGYQADPPYDRFLQTPGYKRTNNGDLLVFLADPAEENVMIRVLEL